MMTMAEQQEAIIQKFMDLDELSRYDMLMVIGMSGESNPDIDIRREENRFTGCQSNLWFELGWENDRLRLHCDSDALVVRACGLLMCDLLSGAERGEIRQNRINFWNHPCFDQLLSAETRRGLDKFMQYVTLSAINSER